MAASVGSAVHPWYKGNHEWRIKGIAELEQSVKYHNEEQGAVCYDPKITLLEGNGGCSALWFNYWISTDKTGGKMKWGGGPPILEESVLLELMKKAIRNKLLSDDFLTQLAEEIRAKTGGEVVKTQFGQVAQKTNKDMVARKQARS